MWTAVLHDADQGYIYMKRFTFEPSAKKQRFIGENPASELILLSDAPGARVEVKFGGGDAFREAMIVDATEFIAVKSFKAKGKRLTMYEVESVTEIEPRPVGADEDAAEDLTDDDVVEVEDAAVQPEQSDEEVRDEINGQQHLF